MLNVFKTFVRGATLFALLLTISVIVGCSSNSPTGPGEGEKEPPTVKTPKAMIIRSIETTSFANTKSGGDTWDWDPLSKNARKPDIYVKLNERNAKDDYVSTIKKNVSSGTYDLSSKRSSSKKSMPYECDYDINYTVKLMDDDLIGSEEMGQLGITPRSLYKNDEATDFTIYIEGTHSFRVRIKGTWVYE